MNTLLSVWAHSCPCLVHRSNLHLHMGETTFAPAEIENPVNPFAVPALAIRVKSSRLLVPLDGGPWAPA